MVKRLVVKNADDYKEDKSKVESGVRLKFGEGRYITVTRAGPGNRRYKARLTQIMEQYSKVGQVRALDMEDEQATEMFYELYADTVVLGWGGWIGEDDKEIPYSKENMIAFFAEYPEIFTIVRDEAEELKNFTVEARKNLGNS